MGWNTANTHFDEVAHTVVSLDIPNNYKTKILSSLISTLQNGDWDTENESLELFSSYACVVAAFEENGIILYCKCNCCNHRD